MKHQNQSKLSLCRDIYLKKGYVFAESPESISKKSRCSKVAMLGSNENPYSPPQHIINAAMDVLHTINKYPDPQSLKLVSAIHKYIYDHTVIVSGLGMDGVIETVIRTLINPKDKVVVSTPTFSMYGLSAASSSAIVKNVPRNPDDFSVDVDTFINESKEAKLSFICTPNNPTGTVTPVSDIEQILSEIPGILFLDNAYVEFCDTDYTPLLKKYDNLIIGRTLSKVYGLAGLRIGYGFIPQWFEAPYHSAETPFTLNRISEASAVAAVSDSDYCNKFIEHVKKWRNTFIQNIPYPVTPSGSNFVMFNVAPMLSKDVVERFAQSGVLVRSCESFPGLGNTYIRVSIGDTWENERFLSVVKNL